MISAVFIICYSVSLFWCPRKAVLRGWGIYWVSSHIVFAITQAFLLRLPTLRSVFAACLYCLNFWICIYSLRLNLFKNSKYVNIGRS